MFDGLPFRAMPAAIAFAKSRYSFPKSRSLKFKPLSHAVIDGRGCALGKGIALSQETVLSPANAPYPVEDTEPQSSSTKNQTAAWIEVNRRILWRIRDEETESSLDAGSGVVVFCPHGPGQDSSQPTQSVRQADTSPGSAFRNIKPCTLQRSDVWQQKSEMVGEVMQLSAADAAKFWPIYNEYDAQLNKLNDLRVANIQE